MERVREVQVVGFREVERCWCLEEIAMHCVGTCQLELW